MNFKDELIIELQKEILELQSLISESYQEGYGAGFRESRSPIFSIMSTFPDSIVGRKLINIIQNRKWSPFHVR